MKYLIIAFVVFCISLPMTAMAGFFGGLDVKEMKEIQEKTYQTGLSCKRRDRLDSCTNFLDAFRKQVDLFKKHEKEINERAAKGDSDCNQIIHNGKINLEIAESIR